MKNIAIIPARSGSKGVKDKNIRPLNGVPLIGYAIKAALDSKMFDTVMVSTDSVRYQEVAIQLGAECPFLRSEATSSDKASSWDAVKEVIANYHELGKEFDSLTLLQPTSPMRKAEDIVGAFELFNEKNANAVVSVCEMEHSPLWSNTLEDDLSMVHFYRKGGADSNRQMLKTFYRLNGAIYLMKTECLQEIDKLYANRCYAFVMPQERSVDIDTELDFHLADFLMKEGLI